MTEDEQLRSPAYLQGRIDALETMVESLVRALPPLGLRFIRSSLRHPVKHITEQRDQDPAHIDWDRHQRSHFPLDAPPPITLRARGFLDYAQPTIEWLDGEIFERAEGDPYSILAATPEAHRRETEIRSEEVVPGDGF